MEKGDNMTEETGSVLTEEGEQELKERLYASVGEQLNTDLNEALTQAVNSFREEVSGKLDKLFKEVTETWNRRFDAMKAEVASKIEESSSEARRRMQHSTDTMKDAVEDIKELRSTLVASVEPAMRSAVADALETARKYKLHVDAAGDFLSKVRDRQERLSSYIDGLIQRGISPKALDDALSELRSQQKMNMEIISRLHEANKRRLDRTRNGHRA